MITSVYYYNATEAVRELFLSEFKTLPSGDVDRLLNVFYRFVQWEEEGDKIRPSIILTNNINSVVKTIPETSKISFYVDQNSSSFNERLKSLMCFCTSGWTVYINYTTDTVEYGLIKCTNSLKDKDLASQIFMPGNMEIIAGKAKLVSINVLSSGLIHVKGVKGNQTSVHFSLVNRHEQDWDSTIKCFVNDCVSRLKTTQKKLDGVKNILENIFSKCFKSLHGTICLVVDKDFKDTKGVFSDGTWLPEPIEFGKLFLQSKSFSESKLRSYADIFTTMLNYDGITIIDNQGRIRAYNVFIENNKKVAQHIVGGARLRAAYTLLNTTSKKIVGVYFQSHDGGAFYKSTQQAKKELNAAQREAEKQQSFKQLEMALNNDKNDN